MKIIWIRHIQLIKNNSFFAQLIIAICYYICTKSTLIIKTHLCFSTSKFFIFFLHITIRKIAKQFTVVALYQQVKNFYLIFFSFYNFSVNDTTVRLQYLQVLTHKKAKIEALKKISSDFVKNWYCYHITIEWLHAHSGTILYGIEFLYFFSLFTVKNFCSFIRSTHYYYYEINYN